MAEHRMITLQNTETDEEIRVKVEVTDLKPEHLANTDLADRDAATIEAAADRARLDYEHEHGGHYLVINIERG